MFDVKFEKFFHFTFILLSVCSCSGSIAHVSTGKKVCTIIISNSVKVSVLFDEPWRNFLLYLRFAFYFFCSLSIAHLTNGWYELWEKCGLVFSSNSRKVSVLFDIDYEKIFPVTCVLLLVSLHGWSFSPLRSHHFPPVRSISYYWKFISDIFLRPIFMNLLLCTVISWIVQVASKRSLII